MARDLPIGNGNMLVAFDEKYLLREFYFPHVGEENHTRGETFQFGVFSEGQFSWVPEGWEIQKKYAEDALVTSVELFSEKQNLRLLAHDCVDFQENIYVKKITVENVSDFPRDVRLFFSHAFHIYGNEVGNTAEYRPESKSLLHYKDRRYFLISTSTKQGYGVLHFATGNKVPGLFEGTWKDAEDGVLSGNPIAQGSVDSVLGITLEMAPRAKEDCYYWICCGQNWEEVKELHEMVQRKKPEEFLKRTQNYWSLWVNKEKINPDLLPAKLLELYKRSLLIVRSQINNCGSIIAANDSDVVLFNRDTYSYMWPRDGALVAHALDLAGYDITIDFYKFCAKILEKEGYFLHKYTPSGALASSWHPWISQGRFQLPIQEDETALVLWALWRHYERFKDIERIRPLYGNLIKKIADFLMNYRDSKTGLALPSYDLWEEKLGLSSFTLGAVIGALMAASKFAGAFGEDDLAKAYLEGALQMKEAMERYLYLPEEQRFARMILFKEDGSLKIDAGLDASLYGIFAFDAFAPEDPKVQSTMNQVEKVLWNEKIGGIARYENDSFFRKEGNQVGNPWFVTTLWLAEYYIACAKKEKDLEKALELLTWVADRALPSGVLSEQIDPLSNKQTSVSPLTWSHGTYISTVQKYLDKLLEIQKCPACGQSKRSKFLNLKS
jgi:GH15 family glucan-1,4-alpha-glucosidase